MENSIIKRLQKLRVLAERAGDTPEGRMAQQLFEKLAAKYDVDVKKVQPRIKRIFHYGQHTFRRHAEHLAFSLDLKVYHAGKGGVVTVIEANDEEWEVFTNLVSQVKLLFKEKKKEVMQKLDSYIAGFVEMTYPITYEEPACPVCGTELIYLKRERRFHCPACPYKSKKFKVHLIDSGEYDQGAAASGKLLK